MGAKQPLYPHQPRKKPVQYPHAPNRQTGRAPSTGSVQYDGGWKPGDLAIYSDFGLRSLFIVRVLEWPEEKGDRFTEHFGSGGVFASISHDRAGGSVRAEVIDTSLVDWDFSWEPRISEHNQEGTVHYYHHTNLYRTIDEIIESQRRILYPEILVKMLYDLRAHPGWVMLEVYGLRGDTKAYAPAARRVPYIGNGSHPAGMPFNLYQTGSDAIFWANSIDGKLTYIKVKVDTNKLARVGTAHVFLPPGSTDSAPMSKRERLGQIIGGSTAYASRITPGQWLPYLRCNSAQYYSSEDWEWCTIEWGGTVREEFVTVTVDGIRGLSQVDLEDIFSNSSVLIGVSK